MLPGVGDSPSRRPRVNGETMTTETLPIVSDDPATQAMYEHVRGNGESHNFAKICALRQGPGLSTDTTFMAGVGTISQQCNDDPKEIKRLIGAAKAQGVNVNMHSLYNATLAPQLGHRDGFVPHDNPKAHNREVCERRGKDCEGLVNYTAPERSEPLPPSPKLSKKLIREEVVKAVERDPGIPTRKGAMEKLQHDIKERHGFRLDRTSG